MIHRRYEHKMIKNLRGLRELRVIISSNYWIYPQAPLAGFDGALPRRQPDLLYCSPARLLYFLAAGSVEGHSFLGPFKI